MPTPAELEEKFWKALKSDMTMMLSLEGADITACPMTAQLEGARGPIWFFTSKENRIAQNLDDSDSAVATFSSKGHDLFATVSGGIALDNNRTAIDRLWNPYVAAWFKGGKDDPELTLLRFDAEHAEIWLDGSSLLAGIKLMFGADPKKNYKDNVAEVRLR